MNDEEFLEAEEDPENAVLNQIHRVQNEEENHYPAIETGHLYDAGLQIATTVH